jgi:phage terminase large subunit
MIIKNPKYKPIYLTDKRYIILTGGRGSGKSHAISTFLCELTYDYLQKIMFTRYTMTSAEISIIPEFKSKIEGLEVPQAFAINKADIKNRITGNEILFRGLKTSSGLQTANLKSIEGVSCWCNDESEELIDETLFDTIDLSIRTKSAQNRVILILNPSDKTHFIYRRWIDGYNRTVMIDGYPVEISTHPDVLHIHTTYFDNIKNVDASFIRIAERMKVETPQLYGHKIIGQWREANEGAIFPKNNLKLFDVAPKFVNTIAYIDVADEGNDYLCMVVAGFDGKNLYIIDIVFSQANTDVTTPLVLKSLKDNNVAFVRIESNSMGSMFKRNIERELPKVWVGGATSTTNKFARIFNDSVFITEVMRFRSVRTPMYEAALTQLAEFTRDGKAKHDDVADALSGLAMFARGIFTDKFV